MSSVGPLIQGNRSHHSPTVLLLFPRWIKGSQEEQIAGHTDHIGRQLRKWIMLAWHPQLGRFSRHLGWEGNQHSQVCTFLVAGRFFQNYKMSVIFNASHKRLRLSCEGGDCRREHHGDIGTITPLPSLLMEWAGVLKLVSLQCTIRLHEKTWSQELRGRGEYEGQISREW